MAKVQFIKDAQSFQADVNPVYGSSMKDISPYLPIETAYGSVAKRKMTEVAGKNIMLVYKWLSPDEAEALRTFIFETCIWGTTEFTLVDWNGDYHYHCRFMDNEYNFLPSGFNTYEVTLSIKVESFQF